MINSDDERSKPDPIAIVGMGCRFAGSATSPQALWEMLERGSSAWSRIPSSRFDVSGVYHPNGKRVGSTNVRGGHFLTEDVALFDASFFNMTNEVARCMDPQYRLMLEVVYEALESAGMTLEGIQGTRTSVFAGCMYNDYQDSLIRDPDTLPRYFITGNAGAMAANRISHFYNLRGPSVTLDTACSTTLTALHLAHQSLRNGESDMAIVAGANLLLNADVFISMSNLGFLSPDGISYAFDARANGYGRGEGIACIILKSLPNAVRDQDPIRAVIRGTALNQDGRTPTITGPSDVAQADLIRECYTKGEIDITQTAYVEAHGTGTPVGDPLEISAISAAFQPVQTQPLLVGSIKANIGHTEAVSGLASIIKTVMSLEKRSILPNARFLRPSKLLLLDKRHIKIPMSNQDWPRGGGIRRASVQNFGFGGSNAHVILEGYDPPTLATTEGSVHIEGHRRQRIEATNQAILTQPRIYVLSANSEQSCRQMISNLRDYAKRSPLTESFHADLAYTLGSRRSDLPWKAVLATGGTRCLESALDCDWLQPRRYEQDIRVGWVFTGQGAQWHAMGRELIDTFPTFRKSLMECEGYIKEFGASWSIMDELHRDEVNTQVHDAEYSLPLSTAIQISLVRLLWSWGVCPTGITSHSSGEAAAAFAAGALSARSAIGVTFFRGLLTTRPKPALAAKVGMMAVGLGRREADAYISRIIGTEATVLIGSLVVGCVNSHTSVTVSGDLSAINKLEEILKADGVFARRLRVTEAYHSNYMLPVADEFGSLLSRLFEAESGEDRSTKSISDVIYTSPMTGTRVHNLSSLFDPRHWQDSMLQPVEFDSAFRKMCWNVDDKRKAEVDVVIEIGPHSGLGGPIKQIIQQAEQEQQQERELMGRTETNTKVAYLSCLFRNKSAVETILDVAADLIHRGHRVDMDAVNFPLGSSSGRPRAKVIHNLPSYPWNHQTRYWRESRTDRASRHRKTPPHPLIGLREPLSSPSAPSWRCSLRLGDVPWLRDHVVGSNIIFPGAGFISMAIEGLSQTEMSSSLPSTRRVGYSLRDIELKQALILPADADTEVDLRLTLHDCGTSNKSLGAKDWYEFSVHSISQQDPGTWTEHCAGLIRSEKSDNDGLKGSNTQLEPERAGKYSRDVRPKHLWDSLRAVGICHGSAFQNILNIQGDRQGSTCTFAIADSAATMPEAHETKYIVHPTTLDSVIQAGYTPLLSAGTRLRTALVPRGVKSLTLSPNMKVFPVGHVLSAQVTIMDRSPQSFVADVQVLDDEIEKQDSAKTNRNAFSLKMEGLVFQSLGDSLAVQTTVPNQTRNTYGSWLWAPDLASINFGWLGDKLKRSIEPWEVEHIVDLRRCTIHYIQEATGHLTAQDYERLEGHHRRFCTWMLAQLELASITGQLGPDSGNWLHDSAEQRSLLRIKLTSPSHGSVNGEMITRLGPQIPAILRGQTNALDLMMSDRLLTRYYVEALKWSRSNQQAAELVRLCAHKNPRCRVLEIGGGTGGCTEMIIKALEDSRRLQPVDRYDFTDISAGFFEAARERFSSWADVMDFRTLNIEEDPAGQGFESGSYDVIVACQVLHATASLQRTLANVRKLLKSGGKLILVETTNDQLDLCFVFGLLPGWWLSEEPERQARQTPSLSPAMWHRTLSTSGFSGVEFEVHDCNQDEFYMISTMMSTATIEHDHVSEAQLPCPEPTSHHPDLAVVNSPNSTSGVVLLYGPPAISSLQSLDWLSNLQTAFTIHTGVTPSIMSFSEAEAEVIGKTCIFVSEIEWSLFGNVGTEVFESIKTILTNCGSVLWVTRGAAVASEDPWKALHLGVLRSLRNESSSTGKRFVSLDVDAAYDPWTSGNIDAVCKVYNTVLGDHDPRTMGGAFGYGQEFEFAERGGVIQVPRSFECGYSERSAIEGIPTELSMEPFDHEGRRLRMDVGIPGLLDSLHFNTQQANHDDNDNDNGGQEDGITEDVDFVEIQPMAFGLNFRDVMVAMGQLEANRIMGFECAGIITRLGEAHAGHPQMEGQNKNGQDLKVGDRVCALLKGHWSNMVRTSRSNVARMPDSMTFQEAASVPLAFTTAYVSLFSTAKIQPGEKVLIHAAAGGVGQAAILLAQHVNAEVFATAGTQAKRDFIRDRFGIRPDHIFSSRDTSFVDGIRAVSAQGVDVVLNSLAGSLLQASFDCLATFGRFVELGKRDLEQDSRLGMHAFTRNVSFSSVDILAWQTARGSEISKALAHVMSLLEQDRIGLITPRLVHSISHIEKAFRIMQGGQHIGKVVVSVEDRAALVPVREAKLHVPSLRLKAEASYIVVGGFGGIGRRICEWMVDHGARHLVILSRGAKKESFVASLKSRGCAVSHYMCDVADQSQLASALREHQNTSTRPVRGVIQGAMVLRDSLFSQMTADDFNAAVRPKAQGSWNLHKQVKGVDFFIMLSSLVGIMGGAGQANYAAASVFQDALASHRRALGLPAIAIDLGMVKSIGYVAETADHVAERLSRIGYQALHEEDILYLLEQAIVPTYSPSPPPCHDLDSSAFSLPAAVITGINRSAGVHWTEATWIQENRFLGLRYRETLEVGKGRVSSGGSPSSSSDVWGRVSESSSRDEAVGIILEKMTEKLLRMLGTAEHDMSSSRSLASVGVDSLVAIELRNWITTQLQVDVSVFELMGGQTVADLAAVVLDKHNQR